jgi:hypothetical protein
MKNCTKISRENLKTIKEDLSCVMKSNVVERTSAVLKGLADL